ncbi:MAG: ribosome biogenesis GTPase Der [Dehalococcoidia bacterium]
MSETTPAVETPPAAIVRPVVAIVGRPNVGKSALFNRMVGRRQALVEDLAGTTRDRIYGDVSWRHETFRLVDTGGLEAKAEEGYPDLIRRQVEVALAEASVLLCVVDAKAGITVGDEEVAELLRRANKPVFLLANKVEGDARREALVEFFELGLGEPMPVSAIHGAGVAEVLDRVLQALPPSPEEEELETPPRLAIVGRPNVGKSMLLNTILGEQRVIVSDVPGTTRDAVDTPFDFEGRPIVLIDTAGLRRPGRLERGLEQHSAMRARDAIERADVALVLFDAREGLSQQDLHIAGFALKATTGLVLAANKWDLMEGFAPRVFEREARRKLRFAPWASFRVCSAQEGTGISALLQEALRIHDERKKRIETGPFNAFLHRVLAKHPAPPSGTRVVTIFYGTQAAVSPPTFVFFANDASLVHFGYKRHLENEIRKQYGFKGTALKLIFRSRKET